MVIFLNWDLIFSPDSCQAIRGSYFSMVGLWIGVLFAAALPLLLLVSLHVCLAGCGSALGCRCSAAALPLLLLVSLHVCLAGLCLPSCGSGSALGCRCFSAAPACLPSCLPCWPLSPFMWRWIGAWLPLLCRC